MQAPQMPDPMQTAQAQGGLNKQTAIDQQRLNMVDQTNPFGSTSYSETMGPDGTPKFTQTQSYSPQVQGLFDANLAKLAEPFSMDTSAIESRLMDLGRARLDPLLDRRRASTEQQLFNTGARPGSEAYKNAMADVSMGENDAWTQLMLNGRNQALSELLAGRNQPLNEIASLRSGTQMGATTPQAGVAPTDYSGLVGQKYAADSKQYGDMWNGIGQLAGAAGGWAFSDERLKTDVRSTGAETPDGIPIKTYRFKGSPMMQMGVIAQQAEKVRPDAVRSVGGIRQVNYPKIMGA